MAEVNQYDHFYIMEDLSHIIRRSLDKDLETQLQYLHDGMVSAINFGAEILDNDFKKGGNDLDLPPVLFFRNLLGNIDAIAVLVKNSIIEPCHGLLRTVLENFFSIEYLLIDDQLAAERAANFMVWDFVNRQRWFKKADINTPEHLQLMSKYRKDRVMKLSPVLKDPKAEIAWRHIESIFQSSPFKEAKQRYDQAKKPGRKNPAWYSLNGGPGSLEELANQLGYPALYEMLYRNLSQTTHGNEILHRKLSFDPNSIATLSALRNPGDAASTIYHCMHICYMTFHIYIQKRVPFMGRAYRDWLIEIRPFQTKLSVGMSNRDKLTDF